MFQLFQGLAQMKDYFKAQTKPSFSATERLQSDICVHDEHLFGFHHFSENQKKNAVIYPAKYSKHFLETFYLVTNVKFRPYYWVFFQDKPVLF